jgi:hypothetical protein
MCEKYSDSKFAKYCDFDNLYNLDKFNNLDKFDNFYNFDTPFFDNDQKYLDDFKFESKNLKCGKFIYPLNTKIDGMYPSEFLKGCGLQPEIENIIDNKIILKIPDIPIKVAKKLWKYLNIHNNNEIEAAVLPPGTIFSYE